MFLEYSTNNCAFQSAEIWVSKQTMGFLDKAFLLHIQFQNQRPEPCLPIYVVSRSNPVARENISNYCDPCGRQTWHPPDTTETWLVHVR